jgi:hypothetical protein
MGRPSTGIDAGYYVASYQILPARVYKGQGFQTRSNSSREAGGSIKQTLSPEDMYHVEASTYKAPMLEFRNAFLRFRFFATPGSCHRPAGTRRTAHPDAPQVQSLAMTHTSPCSYLVWSTMTALVSSLSIRYHTLSHHYLR